MLVAHMLMKSYLQHEPVPTDPHIHEIDSANKQTEASALNPRKLKRNSETIWGALRNGRARDQIHSELGTQFRCAYPHSFYASARVLVAAKTTQ